MQLKQWMNGLCLGALLVTGSAFAQAGVPNTEQLQMPRCLADKMTTHFPVLAENREFKILDIPSNQLQSIALLADHVGCGRFVNVSHQLRTTFDLKSEAKRLLQTAKPLMPSAKAHYEIKHPAEVEDALSQVESDRIWNTLSHLTTFYNRSAKKQHGVDAALWVKDTFENMAQHYERQDTQTFLVDTGIWYRQPSVVTVIGKDLKEPGIVIGAHIDTLDGRMPGAGDDGSGSSTVMEVARVLLASHVDLKRPVYIIWYAAEEMGLVGSQYVVDYFSEHHIPVKAAIQFDMTGYRSDKNDPTIWVYEDYTDKALNAFISELLKTYVKVPVGYSSCGYGCSDHASWMDGGVPAAFPCETSFDVHNPYIHSIDDDLWLIHPEHMTNFAKLGLAFAIELASE